MALHYVTVLCGCVRMAARRGGDEEFEHLGRRLGRLDPAVVGHWRADVDEFLTELAALSQSPRLTHELMLRHLEFAPYLRLLDADPDARRSQLDHLERLLALVEAGEASRASDECEAGVRDLLDRVIRLRARPPHSTAT